MSLCKVNIPPKGNLLQFAVVLMINVDIYPAVKIFALSSIQNSRSDHSRKSCLRSTIDLYFIQSNPSNIFRIQIDLY